MDSHMGGVTPVVEPFHRGWSRLVTDNDVVTDRPSLVTWVAKDRPYYSGKHKRHGVNLQFIASPAGDMLLQGSCCELYRRYFR